MTKDIVEQFSGRVYAETVLQFFWDDSITDWYYGLFSTGDEDSQTSSEQRKRVEELPLLTI